MALAVLDKTKTSGLPQLIYLSSSFPNSEGPPKRAPEFFHQKVPVSIAFQGSHNVESFSSHSYLKYFMNRGLLAPFYLFFSDLSSYT